MFTNRFVEVSFFLILENYFQIYGKNLNFPQKFLLNFKTGYQLKDRLLPCVPVYSPGVYFNLTPLFTAFEKVSEGIVDTFLIFHSFSQKVHTYF